MGSTKDKAAGLINEGIGKAKQGIGKATDNASLHGEGVAIGMVLAQTLGLGIILMIVVTSQFNIHQVEGILFGSLITLTDNDLLALAGTALAATERV